ncbi:hypothetical protein WJX73_008995 [Symbiochloris irregularis]|uniref:Uncharacterized protein n=1 Tax=Symbiochloris irregularis TaxID=706552 RepID=A0AAW1NN51_9CHLO
MIEPQKLFQKRGQTLISEATLLSTLVHSLVTMHSSSGSRPGRRMVLLGNVKAPKPVNLPSQRRENHGLDPNINIVPKHHTSVWGDPTQVNASASETTSRAPSEPTTPHVHHGPPASRPSGANAHTEHSHAPRSAAAAAWGGAGMPEKRQRATEGLRPADYPSLGEERHHANGSAAGLPAGSDPAVPAPKQHGSWQPVLRTGASWADEPYEDHSPPVQPQPNGFGPPGYHQPTNQTADRWQPPAQDRWAPPQQDRWQPHHRQQYPQQPSEDSWRRGPGDRHQPEPSHVRHPGPPPNRPDHAYGDANAGPAPLSLTVPEGPLVHHETQQVTPTKILRREQHPDHPLHSNAIPHHPSAGADNPIHSAHAEHSHEHPHVALQQPVGPSHDVHQPHDTTSAAPDQRQLDRAARQQQQSAFMREKAERRRVQKQLEEQARAGHAAQQGGAAHMTGAAACSLDRGAYESVNQQQQGGGQQRQKDKRQRGRGRGDADGHVDTRQPGAAEASRRPDAHHRERQPRSQQQNQHTAGDQAEQARKAAAAALADSASGAVSGSEAHRKADRGPSAGAPAASKDWLADDRPSGKAPSGNKDWLADEGGSNDSEGVRRRGTTQFSGSGGLRERDLAYLDQQSTPRSHNSADFARVHVNEWFSAATVSGQIGGPDLTASAPRHSPDAAAPSIAQAPRSVTGVSSGRGRGRPPLSQQGDPAVDESGPRGGAAYRGRDRPRDQRRREERPQKDKLPAYDPAEEYGGLVPASGAARAEHRKPERRRERKDRPETPQFTSVPPQFTSAPQGEAGTSGAGQPSGRPQQQQQQQPSQPPSHVSASDHPAADGEANAQGRSKNQRSRRRDRPPRSVRKDRRERRSGDKDRKKVGEAPHGDGAIRSPPGFPPAARAGTAQTEAHGPSEKPSADRGSADRAPVEKASADKSPAEGQIGGHEGGKGRHRRPPRGRDGHQSKPPADAPGLAAPSKDWTAGDAEHKPPSAPQEQLPNGRHSGRREPQSSQAQAAAADQPGPSLSSHPQSSRPQRPHAERRHSNAGRGRGSEPPKNLNNPGPLADRGRGA